MSQRTEMAPQAGSEGRAQGCREQNKLEKWVAPSVSDSPPQRARKTTAIDAPPVCTGRGVREGMAEKIEVITRTSEYAPLFEPTGHGQLYLWQPVRALPVLTNRVSWLLSFGSIAMHEPVNSRHCRRDTDHASE